MVGLNSCCAADFRTSPAPGAATRTGRATRRTSAQSEEEQGQERVPQALASVAYVRNNTSIHHELNSES